jgi:hypothetical protein
MKSKNPHYNHLQVDMNKFKNSSSVNSKLDNSPSSSPGIIAELDTPSPTARVLDVDLKSIMFFPMIGGVEIRGDPDRTERPFGDVSGVIVVAAQELASAADNLNGGEPPTDIEG